MTAENIFFQPIVPNLQLPFRFLIHNSGQRHHVLRHWHESFEIDYVITGANEHVYLDGQKFRQESGEIMVANPYQVHGMDLEDDPHRIAVTIMLPLKFMQSLGIDVANWRITSRILPSTDDHYLQACAYIEQLYYAQMNARTNGSQARKIGLTCLLLQVLVDNFGQRINPHMIESTSHNLSYVKAALDFVKQHSDQPITITTLAEQAGLSPSYFAHLFRQQIGESPLKYVNQMRVHHARQLLLNSDATMLEIAMQTGFPNVKSFTSQFKAEYGITPYQFKKGH